MSAATKVTQKKKDKFLKELASHGCVLYAADATSMSRTSWYRLRERDKEFAQRWDEALELATEVLIQEARRRAYAGVDEPIHYKGERVDTVKRYSDTLLIFLLKGLRPEMFADRKEITGKGGGPVEFAWTDLLKSVDDE